jgi:guanylate kinase
LKKEEGFSQPIQFTTRPQRSDKELDEYVFLTKENYFNKLERGDFANFQRYGNEFYAISKHFDKEKNIVIIVDPIGKLQLEKFFKESGIGCKSIYIDIDKETMGDRLQNLRRETVQVIEQRKKDFDYFSSVGFDFVVDGTTSIDKCYDKVVKAIKAYGFQ